MFWLIVVCAVIPAITAFPPEAAAQERTQAEAARDLRSADTIRIRAALNEFAMVPVAEQTPELRRALVEALEREHASPMFRDSHVLVGLARATIEIGRVGDPVAIPALALFTMSGWSVFEVLASLGDPALRAVLNTASSPESRSTMVGDALRALEMFIDKWGLDAFDEPTYQEMKVLAAKALEGPTDFYTLAGTIGLAVLLEDPELRAMVEDLASSDDAVRARGVTNPRAIVEACVREHKNRMFGDGHMLEGLAEAAIEIGQVGDPIAIPALARFPMAGWSVYEVLASLGDPALRAVLNTASSPESKRRMAANALMALEMFVDKWGLDAFDEPTYEQMKALAAKALEGPTDFYMLVNTIGLAILLEDPKLRATVEELASSDDAVRARGVTNPRAIAKIREKAKQRLADPTPPWRKRLP